MRFGLIALALAASACGAATMETTASAPPATPTWESARAEGVDFRAVGQEPGWLLDVYQRNHIVLEWDYGEQRVVFPLAEPSYPVEGQTRYEAQADGHTLSISIRRYPCTDTMSGEAFPASVEIRIDGRALQGCGRSV